ncbi:SulP family inorganic anion transporter [Intrasporangium sp.]|uniref:SulP family inorganic anion transporter n=1 Tax=Intrasporangium sp. TaxID=1925024 RepID=UPI00293B49B4|nr:SulP family inorganic anion transporter [Intrasporangium sp.]MDV3222209.1 SulP family inorganic anion transporter [Intrasporangium sp.]
MTERRQARWERLAPGLGVLLSYDRAWLRGDVLAGITVSAYLVPQVMAYAEVAGLPAITGLWACAPALVVYALLGSSRQLSVGPESTTALMTAAGVGALVGTVGAGRHAEVAALLALAVGVVCVLAWLARLGFLAELLSKPVLVGYMAGIAALMVVSQLGKITGIDVEGGTFLEELRYTATHLGEAHWPTLAVAATVLAALLAFGRWARRWPGPLIAMLTAAAAVQVLGLVDDGVAVVGEVPQGLPPLGLPRLDDVEVWTLVPAAVGVAVVAYSDNVLTGRAFALKRREAIDSNQEFVALGFANIASSMSSGFPVSSSGSRTVLADAMGARTQLHSLVSVVVLAATMFWLGPVLATFPEAALGGVVVYAALRLVDVAELRRITAFRRAELVLSLSTTFAVLVFGVLPGIGVAIVLSVLELLRRIVHPHDGVLGYVPDVAGMHDIDDHSNAVQVPGLVVYRYDSPLFFANSHDFVRRALGAVSDSQRVAPVEWFLLNAEANTEVDLTAVDALDTLRISLEEEGIRFAMARVKQDMRDSLEAAGFVDNVGIDLIFPTLPTAVAAYARWYEQAHGHPLTGLEIPPVPPQPRQATD